jgi:hypothetical protein
MYLDILVCFLSVCISDHLLNMLTVVLWTVMLGSYNILEECVASIFRLTPEDGRCSEMLVPSVTVYRMATNMVTVVRISDLRSVG